MFKVVRGGVYTGLANGARGILFPDHRDQGLAVKNRQNAKGCDAAMAKQGSQPRFVECVKKSTTDRFAQAGEVVKEGLSLGAELVLVGLPEMAPVEGREVGVRVKRGHDQRPFRMQSSMPFLERACRRWNIGQ